MIAFIAFVKSFGIWIYLLCALGILIGIKMLMDARGLSRTTLFALDQERAVAQTMRGLVLIAVMAAIIFAVTFINVIIAPFVPSAEPPIARGVTPTLAQVFPPSSPTPVPSPTSPKPTETPFFTVTAPLQATRTPTPRPPQAASPTANLLPAPVLVYDKSRGDAVFNGVSVNNENAMHTGLIFKWSWNCPQCVLGPNDKFVVVVTFTEKATSATRTIAGGTQETQLTLGKIISGYGDSGQFYQKAKDNSYQWYVQVKRSPGDQPVSAPSEIWKFVWN